MEFAGRNRALIYCFYDKNGIVDRYVTYYLTELGKFADYILIVVNGKLSEQGRAALETCSDEIIVRDNAGLDTWAYKEGLEHIGWEKLQTKDEVILANDTVFGPVYPFSEMFEAMGERDELDFWGITKGTKVDVNPFNCKYGFTPDHIQSYFTVYRKKFVASKELHDYWAGLPKIGSFTEAVGKHELCFAKHFSDLGFNWDVYVNAGEETYPNDYILMHLPKWALSRCRCPVFKRKSFFEKQDAFLWHTAGEQTIELLDYVKNNTDYDTEMVWENILRKCNHADIARTLGLYYILSKDHLLDSSKSDCSFALFMHLRFTELLDESLRCASAFPACGDIYVTTTDEQSAKSIEDAFSVLPNKVEVRIMPDGGYVASLLVCLADVAEKYDYVCVFHDREAVPENPIAVDKSLSFTVSESTLASEEYVRNVLHTFETNRRLGLLTPFGCYHSVYFGKLGREWGLNFENTVSLAGRLGLSVPIDENKSPIAPFEHVFWFRTKAMKKMLSYEWTPKRLPAERPDTDGLMSGAVCFLYPFVAQDAGYYSAFVFSDKLAAIEIINLKHYSDFINTMASKLGAYGGFLYTFSVLQDRIENNVPDSMKGRIKIGLKMLLPRWLYKGLGKVKRFIFGPRQKREKKSPRKSDSN